MVRPLLYCFCQCCCRRPEGPCDAQALQRCAIRACLQACLLHLLHLLPACVAHRAPLQA